MERLNHFFFWDNSILTEYQGKGLDILYKHQVLYQMIDEWPILY